VAHAVELSQICEISLEAQLHRAAGFFLLAVISVELRRCVWGLTLLRRLLRFESIRINSQALDLRV
jgi:hypothetical protein